jgi:hypothetical protein
MIFDVIDECFFIQDTNPSKVEETEKLINDAVSFHEEMLGAISAGKSKTDFRPIMTKIEEKQREYVGTLNGLMA